MTGIERLRQMAEDFKNAKTSEHCALIVNTWRGMYIDDAISDIADQIEREQRHDPAADVSMSAYDLLPDEDRDAIAWVREHGGLDAVRASVEQGIREHGYLCDIASVCQSCRCGTPTMSLVDGMAAVNRWNLRVERTCRKVPGRMKYGRRMPKCSECGQSLGDERWVYCPSCGARVVTT